MALCRRGSAVVTRCGGRGGGMGDAGGFGGQGVGRCGRGSLPWLKVQGVEGGGGEWHWGRWDGNGIGDRRGGRGRPGGSGWRLVWAVVVLALATLPGS